MNEETKLSTVQDLINKLKEFDTSLPILAWDHGDWDQCVMPVNVDGIYSKKEEVTDFDRNIIFEGDAVIMNTMYWPKNEQKLDNPNGGDK